MKSARCVALLLAVLFTLLYPAHTPAGAAEPVHLNADKISYEESSGVATAEGNVRINNDEIRLFAPYVEYDSNTQQIRALSSPEGPVTFVAGEGKLSGERLEYNVETRTGLLTHPYGRADAFYVRGDVIEVKPAPEKKRKSTEETSEEQELAARWNKASLTTCNEAKPHYRLEAKEVSVIPGRHMIVKKPKVYIGERQIFAYPFDYYVPLQEKKRGNKQRIFPKLGYESSKGAGIGFTGGFAWERGTLDLEAIAWTEGVWEGETTLRHEIATDLTLYGSMKREYDKDHDTTNWRPSWGMQYERSGWQLEAGWTQRELVTLEKRAGHDSRYIVWRKPEVNLVSPWIADPAAGGHYRLLGTWGRYEDATHGPGPTVERAGAGIQMYGEFSPHMETFQPFYNALYWYYHYDDDRHDEQQILDAVFGVRWKTGDVDLETAYLRRWTWGQSPMEWDAYEPREEIYQEIGYTFPTKSQTISWRAGLRAAYSLRDEELAEMVYKVTYDQHCLLWEGIYRDDRRGDDDWFGLTLTIKAYPESGARLSGNELFEPAKAPNELVPNLY